MGSHLNDSNHSSCVELVAKTRSTAVGSSLLVLSLNIVYDFCACTIRRAGSLLIPINFAWFADIRNSTTILDILYVDFALYTVICSDAKEQYNFGSLRIFIVRVYSQIRDTTTANTSFLRWDL